MDRYQSNKKYFFIMFILILLFTGCEYIKKGGDLFTKWTSGYEYKGMVDVCRHHWLKGRRILIDPGHGGKENSDKFRIGPNGATEGNINLNVGLILSNMLERAGAVVKMTRSADEDIPLEKRVKITEEFNPEILVSIHHNGSPRRKDAVNHSNVIIWGNREIKPESYDFAGYLLDEFNRMMGIRGTVISDYSIFSETGTRILNGTKSICTGVIGEAGFFSDPVHAIKLKDFQFNEREAEAYFYALSKYFKRGIPSAEVLISCPIEKVNYSDNIIKNRRPLIWIKTDSGNDKEIDARSFIVTINDLRVYVKKYFKNYYRVMYGDQLYPGGHKLRFHFRNKWGQSSMVYYLFFMVEMNKGEYDYYAKRGRYLLNWYSTAREGLKMLLAVRTMGITGPNDDRILWDISRGFGMISDYSSYEYYSKMLYFFYPQSRYTQYMGYRIRSNSNFRYPVDYYGRQLSMKYFDFDECKKLSGCEQKGYDNKSFFKKILTF